MAEAVAAAEGPGRAGSAGTGEVAAAGPRRELVVAALAVIAVSRLADGPAVWAVGLLLAGAIAAGTMHLLGRAPLTSALMPALAGFACLGAIRLVPVGLALVPVLALSAFLLDRTIRTEARALAARHGPSDADRARLLAEAVVVAFLAFLATAVLVPGGLPEPGAAPGAVPLSEANLVLLAGVDALIAGLLGYRAATLRLADPRAALWSAATYACAIATAAAALRATDIPRLIGPALLALVFFLWDAFHGSSPARRRDPRWIWQTVLLAGLGIVVVVWNLGLR